MAATLNKRWGPMFLGPVKHEVIWITSDGTNDDASLSCLMANPETITMYPVNKDLGGSASGASATFSGKTITLRDPASATDYVIEIYGY